MNASNLPITLSQNQLDAIALVYVAVNGGLWLIDAHGNEICNDWLNVDRDTDSHSRVKELIANWETDGISYAKPVA